MVHRPSNRGLARSGLSLRRLVMVLASTVGLAGCPTESTPVRVSNREASQTDSAADSPPSDVAVAPGRKSVEVAPAAMGEIPPESTGIREPAVDPATPSPSTDAPSGLQADIAALRKLGATIEYGAGDRAIDVDLDGSSLNDDDLEHLVRLDDLKILNLSETAITDAGLSRLAGLKKLKFLYLFDTGITDEGLATLTQLPRLEVLCLDRTRITDAGLKSLAELPRLERLHVHSREALTDAGLEFLKVHTRLFELRLGGPGFTEQGLTSLREALPDCNVIYDSGVEAPDESR